MSTPDSLHALRGVNPRSEPDFEERVSIATHATRARIAADDAPRPSRPRRTVVPANRRAVAGGLLAATAVVVAAVLALGSPGGEPGVEDAAAAIKQAATVTAASAELSGTATLRITNDGRAWADTTIRWNGDDLVLASNMPDRAGRIGGGFRLVDGTVYLRDPSEGGWVATGSPANIDPDSGTTPTELLAAVREDVGGATLPRLVAGMTGLTTVELEDGSTRYTGEVAAGLIAQESGYKEGQSIRVFPFGNVAHGTAADPAAQVEFAVTVGSDGVIRELAATWPGWTYTVAYSELGSTPAPKVPGNARPLRRG